MRTIGKILGDRLSLHRRGISAIDKGRAREALSCYSFMGCISRTGARELLENLQKSYAAARSFAESRDFSLALTRLGKTGLEWERAQIPVDRCNLLVANCSLGALSLIAGAKIKGWHLVVEDCPFSKSFIAAIGARDRGGVELQPGHLLLARQRDIRRTGCHGPVLFVAFCDRPGCAAGDGIETEMAGGRYHLSVVDALLMAAAFDEVFVLGRELRTVAVADRINSATDRISGETLFHSTSLCGGALSDVIAAAPGQYLGATQLVTRSAKFRAITEGSKRSLVKSLLHYYQINGMPIPEQSYRRLLLKLDARDPGCEVEAHPA